MCGNARRRGQPIFEDLYAQGKAGGGYVDYLFRVRDRTMPCQDQLCGYEPEWGWLLFTGLYVDDVDAAFRATLWRQGGVTLGLLAVVLLAALRFFRTHIIRPLDEAVVVCERWRRRSVQYRVASSPGRDRPAVRRHGADAGTLDVAVRSIVHSTGSIAALAPIAAGSMDLHDRTEKQAARWSRRRPAWSRSPPPPSRAPTTCAK